MAYNWIGVLYTLRKFFCFLLHCQASQTNVIKPNFAKWWTVNCANNLLLKSWGRPSQKNRGTTNFPICSVFQWLWDLMVNIFWKKPTQTIRQGLLESTSGTRHCPKISANQTLPSARKVNGTVASHIRCRCIVNVNEAIEIRFRVSRAQRTF